jgi:hypothetical protein
LQTSKVAEELKYLSRRKRYVGKEADGELRRGRPLSISAG